MKKFVDIVRTKINESETRRESKVLEDFKSIYNAMLDHYGLTEFNHLDESSQLSFLTELNNYWSEEEGLSQKGQMFINKRSMSLNENSTATQRKHYLKTRSQAVINETLRQSDIKWKLYNVIDEMYHQVKASDISEILSPDMIVNIIAESFNSTLDEICKSIDKELKESSKPKKSNVMAINVSRSLNEGKTFKGRKR
jgi:hypothetical protein